VIRVFLDANILFSAAWREGSGIGRLWEKQGVHLMTSPYALMEAERNIQRKKPASVDRLSALTRAVEVSSATKALSQDYGLPAKDLPILEAAAGCGCTVLLTGDITHFGHLIGTMPDGVQIMTIHMLLLIETS
jgi:predicted nucleic acid-binding protein